MKRNTASFKLENPLQFRKKMLGWANRFNIFCLLDNHNYTLGYNSYNCIVAANAVEIFNPTENKIEALQKFTNNNNDWIFGHVAYDLKNEIESLSSNNIDNIGFEDLSFFRPETVIEIKENVAIISSFIDPDIIFNAIISFKNNSTVAHQPIHIKARLSKHDYIKKVKQLQQHILRGDCYEINFCQEFFAENVIVDCIELYDKLSATSPNPFAALYKLNDKFCLCASPERFIKKQDDKLISQPIKGTLKRVQKNFISGDEQSELSNSLKDRTENVMIVDLVRNDLNKVCQPGTVKPLELYGIQTFPQVHQMVSTIIGTLKPDTSFAKIIKATFPMGSMTGAPKKRVMELIEDYEVTKRGLYSGTIGYITPDNNFDFNVVIRSLFYNVSDKYVNYHAGGAITFNSIAVDEYEECLLKAEGMLEVLNT